MSVYTCDVCGSIIPTGELEYEGDNIILLCEFCISHGKLEELLEEFAVNGKK